LIIIKLHHLYPTFAIAQARDKARDQRKIELGTIYGSSDFSTTLELGTD
jgi:hypothetical protein